MAISPDKQKSVTEMASPLRSQLGLGSAATRNASEFALAAQGGRADSAVQSINSKTGTSINLTKADIGLNLVDNTRDVDKPISTSVQSALDAINTSLGQKATSAQGTKADNAVLFTSQTLSSPQKAQVLTNVGALSREIGGTIQADVDFAAGTGITDASRGLPKYLIGGYLSNHLTTPDTHLNVDPLEARGNQKFVKTNSTITKRIDQLFAPGSGNGGLDSGSVANSTWYHVLLIRKISDKTGDILFSTSATAPSLPSGYELIMRLGSIKTLSGSTVIRLFTQNGNDFYRRDSDTSRDFGEYNSTSGAIDTNVTFPNVPTGVPVEAWLVVYGTGNTNQNVVFSLRTPGSHQAIGIHYAAYIGINYHIQKEGKVKTDSLARVRFILQALVSPSIVGGNAGGWTDYTIPRIFE